MKRDATVGVATVVSGWCLAPFAGISGDRCLAPPDRSSLTSVDWCFDSLHRELHFETTGLERARQMGERGKMFRADGAVPAGARRPEYRDGDAPVGLNRLDGTRSDEIGWGSGGMRGASLGLKRVGSELSRWSEVERGVASVASRARRGEVGSGVLQRPIDAQG
jgi:hypothetical protein